MVLSATEIEQRHHRVGASDVATILGMPTFRNRNAYTTWLEKCDMLEPEKRTSASISAGNRLEPVVLDYAEEQYGELVRTIDENGKETRSVVVWDKQGAPIASTLDGQVKANGRPVEAKTSGIEGPIHGNWGEAGSDEVPDGYIIQCQTQLLCTGADLCHLPALLGSRGFVEYLIEPIDELMKKIRDVSTDFFELYVIPRRDPREDWADRLVNVHGINIEGDPCEPQLDIVKRYRKVPNKVVQIDDVDMILRWQDARQARLDAEKIEKLEQAKVLAAMGDAEGADLPGGMSLTHFMQNGAASINRDQMKADGVYEKYATANRFRVLRLKTPKKGR
jgi:putative phage-type endonuclease